MTCFWYSLTCQGCLSSKKTNLCDFFVPTFFPNQSPHSMKQSSMMELVHRPTYGVFVDDETKECATKTRGVLKWKVLYWSFRRSPFWTMVVEPLAILRANRNLSISIFFGVDPLGFEVSWIKIHLKLIFTWLCLWVFIFPLYNPSFWDDLAKVSALVSSTNLVHK